MTFLTFLFFQDVIFSVMVTSAYFTETIPLVVFSRDLAKNQKTFSQYDPSIHFSQIRTKYFYSIVSRVFPLSFPLSPPAFTLASFTEHFSCSLKLYTLLITI